MSRLGMGLLYGAVGTLVTFILYRLYPEFGAFSASLLGIILILTLSGFHIMLSLRTRVQQHEIKLVDLRREMGEARARTEKLQNSLLSADHESTRYESLLGEIKIMQSVMDRVIQSTGVPEKAPSKSVDPMVETTLDDKAVINLVNEAVRSDRIEVFLQPIVSLPQRKLRFYELFTRIRTTDGHWVTPERFVPLANENGTLPGIDNLQLLRCVQMIRDSDRRNSTLRFFCNISSATLRDTAFMTELVQFLGQNPLLAPKLIFELSQKDLATMPADLVPLLDGLGRLGCRFSMDGVYSIDFPMAALSARKIRTVKIDSEMILSELGKPGGVDTLKEMKRQLDRTGIDLIISKIETETQLRNLLDLNIDYGQGFLFGEPRANWPIS